METAEDVQTRIIEEFSARGDALGQFDRLLQFAAELEELDDAAKTDASLVKGCQSRVWLHVDWPDEALRLRGDSDTLMVRGVIRIFQIMLEKRPAREVLGCTIRFVEQTELASIFDAKRKTGVAAIWEVIRASAREQLAVEGA